MRLGEEIVIGRAGRPIARLVPAEQAPVRRTPGSARGRFRLERHRPSLFHFRTHAGREVDLVLEDARGRVVGIEVKSAASASTSDFDGLRALAETARTAFVQGVLLQLVATRKRAIE